MRFIEDEQQNSDDLPWSNEYLNSVGQEYDISFIKEIVPGKKGLLVITKDFKGFLFGGSNVAEQIAEAIQSWKTYSQPGYALFARVLPSGKIDIAIDDDSDGILTVDKKGKVTQTLKKDLEESAQDRSNPFIRASTPVPTTKRKAKDTSLDTIGH